MEVDLEVNATQPAAEPSTVSPNSSTTLPVGFVYNQEMTSHCRIDGSTHEEQPARITCIYDAIVKANYHTRMIQLPIREVQDYEALLVHTEDHWRNVLEYAHMSSQKITDTADFYEQQSLYVSPGTTRAARLSTGGVIEACLAVVEGRVRKSIAIVRPPGHHAEPGAPMGFCFLNNVAIAARVVQEKTKIKKIMIVDWDVHHGNGTHTAFNDNNSILYLSLHRYDGGHFYPGGTLGSVHSCGEGAGLGFSVNIPWPGKGMGDADYLHAFQRIVMPIGTEFAPELVIISSGFDAAEGDTLGQCHVTPAGYSHMTHMLSGLANGRLVVALEGGYNLQSISDSALAVTKVVCGDPPEELPPLTASEVGAETVWLVSKQHCQFWKCLDPRACEPREEVEPMSYTIPELVKAHRQYFLASQYHLMAIPILDSDLNERFSTQLLCSSDLFEKQNLIVFVHEFGNLRVELENAKCDAKLETSYFASTLPHIDATKAIIEWTKKENFSLVDINLFPKRPEYPAAHASKNKDVVQMRRELLTYLWDNYIQLSGAKQIIFIGHGVAASHVLACIEQRAAGVMRQVKGIVLVIGQSEIPLLSKNSSDVLRTWYKKHSFVAVPQNHHIFSGEPKIVKRHGKIIRAGKFYIVTSFLCA
ncbi:histone deacetylase complex protein [Fistulina hepatica ATCC 64428]|uniref:histone deacetylase n=1 Tax=Fistulina hepatica ATCC 64428 TaxID=1128425 RepID=A0A0D7AHK0_9AGAR|nr:histone deacetylase complex protein [Fistulina hepatica ATCC 64428]